MQLFGARRDGRPSTIDKQSPVTGESLGTFPVAGKDEVEAAVARARQAFPAWRDTPVEQRLRTLQGIKDVIREHGETFAHRISEDTGKPRLDALMTELMVVALFFDHYRSLAPKVLRRRKVKTSVLFLGKTSYVEPFPMGVIGVIAPWNFPLQLALLPTLSALIAGNTVVLKPSEVTPLTGAICEEIVRRLALPRGLVEVVQGDGSTGQALVQADIDKVFFTGSVATGRKVMAEAAKKPIPVALELGGKDAMIVLADAHLERAAKAAVWGGLLNCGQMCTSVERILVEDAVHDRFVDLVAREVDRVRVGGPDEDADMGPLTSAPQLTIVERHVDEARAAGANIRRGGHPLDRQGRFYAPTLLTEVTPEMAVYQEETFGPVLPVVRVADAEEALRLANDHRYGLTGSVWTADTARGLELASRMECGQVMVNDLVSIVGNPALPFGGVKHSGFGRYHGPEGLMAFSHQKAIMVDAGRSRSEPFWFPYGGKYEDMARVFHGIVAGNFAKAWLALRRLQKRARG